MAKTALNSKTGETRTMRVIRNDAIELLAALFAGDEDAEMVFPKLWEETEEKLACCVHALQRLHTEVIEGEQHLKAAQDYIRRRKDAIAFIEREAKTTMETVGLNKIDRPDAKLTYVKGRDKLEVGSDFDIGFIPEKFVRVIPEKRELDKVAALAAVKDGALLPGLSVGQGEASLRYDKPKGE